MTSRVLERLTGPRTKVPVRQYGSLLLKYFRQQKGIVGLASVLILTNIGLQLVNPQIMRYFIDEAVAGSPLSTLVAAAGVFIVVALVQQVIGVMATYTSGKVGWNATNALRSDLARHALSLDMPFHNSHTPGEMIERIDGDAETLGGFFSTFAVHILGNVIMLVAVLAFLFRENWLAGLVLTVFALISLAVILRMRNVSVANWKANREESTKTYGFIEERLAGRGGYKDEFRAVLRYEGLLRPHVEVVPRPRQGLLCRHCRSQHYRVHLRRGPRHVIGRCGLPVLRGGKSRLGQCSS